MKPNGHAGTTRAGTIAFADGLAAALAAPVAKATLDAADLGIDPIADARRYGRVRTVLAARDARAIRAAAAERDGS